MTSHLMLPLKLPQVLVTAWCVLLSRQAALNQQAAAQAARVPTDPPVRLQCVPKGSPAQNASHATCGHKGTQNKVYMPKRRDHGRVQAEQ